jgi:hypothetical protein
VKNDEHALRALKVHRDSLRREMTGVRGIGPKEKLRLYNEDMRKMFEEVAKALRPGGRAAFVVGDATVDGTEFTTTEEDGHLGRIGRFGPRTKPSQDRIWALQHHAGRGHSCVPSSSLECAAGALQ